MNKLNTFFSGAIKQLGQRQNQLNSAFTKNVAADALEDIEKKQSESHRSLLMFLDKALDAMLNKAGISIKNAATKVKQSAGDLRTPRSPGTSHKKTISKKSAQRQTSPRENKTPQKSPEQKQQNQEMLRQAQKKRLQLMEQLRKLDHKLDEIKRTQNHSRIMSNSNRFENVAVTMKTEREKHEQALKLVKKLNEQKRQRELKKLRELEQVKIEQQKQLEKALMRQPQRPIYNKSNKSHLDRASRQSQTPTTSATPIINSLKNNVMTRDHKPSSLPLVQSNFKETEVNRAKKRLEDIQVTIDPNKRSFPKSKIHYKILNQEKMLKEREAKERQEKMEQLNRRNNYTLSLKNKVLLAPISLTASMPIDLNKTESDREQYRQPERQQEREQQKDQSGLDVSSKQDEKQDVENIQMLKHQPQPSTEIEAPVAVSPQHLNNQFFEDDQLKS